MGPLRKDHRDDIFTNRRDESFRVVLRVSRINKRTTTSNVDSEPFVPKRSEEVTFLLNQVVRVK